MGQRIRELPALFAANATVSGVVAEDKILADESMVGIDIPTGFVGTTLTFLNAIDKTNFRQVLKADGTAYTLTCAENKYVAVDPVIAKGLRDFKLVADSQTGGPITLNAVFSQVS